MKVVRASTAGASIFLAFGVVLSGHASAVLQSEPESAYVAITGQMSMAGKGPLPVEALPVGEYELAADEPGHGMLKGRLIRSDHGISVHRLAGPTSLLLPPGFLHLEHGDRRGWLYWSAGLASGVLLGMSHADVGDADQRHDDARSAYDRAVTETAVESARDELLGASLEKDDRREVRNLWLTYFSLTWVGASVENWLLTPSPRLTRDDVRNYRLELPRSGGWSTGLKSMLVPGAGQRFIGETTRANLFSGAFAVLGGSSILAQEWFLEARRDQTVAQARFDRAVTVDELRSARRELRDFADEAEDREVVRWALVGATAGIYIWNILDAFGGGRSPESSSFTLAVTPAPDGIAAAATWSLP